MTFGYTQKLAMYKINHEFEPLPDRHFCLKGILYLYISVYHSLTSYWNNGRKDFGIQNFVLLDI